MWYHSSGNSLSVSKWHSHSGKLGIKCWGHPIMHRKLPPMVISRSHKGVPNWVKCPQVQVFSLMKNYKYLLIKFILFPCSMKYDTWAPSMHWPWTTKDSKPSLGIFNLVTAPACTYTTYIIAITLSTPTTSHFSAIININSYPLPPIKPHFMP